MDVEGVRREVWVLENPLLRDARELIELRRVADTDRVHM